MGVDIGELLHKKEVEISNLSNKTVAIDAYNTLYQFLSIIRQRDGTPLQDSKGRTTSHLSGILYRITNLVEEDIKPVFVFDGKPPDFKTDTLEKRKQSRENANQKWNEAKEKGLTEEAYKYAQGSARIDDQILDDAKYLLESMGIPYLQSPSEGEAQAAHMVQKGDADYVGSQDYDALLFGAPHVIRNLTITGKRKLPGKNTYIDLKPETIDMEENLKSMGITRSKLIDIALCVGTDYNKGLEKIGPKRALKLVKTHDSIKSIIDETGQNIENVDKVKDFFMNPEVTDDYHLKWNRPNKDKIIQFLCEEHDFSEERVAKACDRLDSKLGSQQKTLDQWF
ncbi:flap structure-specific endonuclease [Methanohalobium evestigatum Z-7303]|uniref:Flap endonuclease 1 n=1 Tax=Methanohalobium evestigatum (strain ATCC BAA-1072 / DSM 3721 / NBRC 107634 / OCM 161 / Z-7303) TaxID=644295 RepID=D7EBE3_METEZ|nr:flap endonuclease-1 [Methanohalobium evestigatum]ADI74660.1 flap structure-specific endonuclease [Methanohalobium evestigatum Z-7303]